MSLDHTYDPANIFAKIVRGEMPSVKVFEDEETLAFMDVFPQTDGHVLVIHKHAHATNLLTLSEDEASAVMRTVQHVAKAVVEALQPDGLRIVQFNGTAAGQTVFHFHMHILPMWEGRTFGRHGAGMADQAKLNALAEKIRTAL
ncbi:MAG: HIT family protein [Myxococcota bacterium]